MPDMYNMPDKDDFFHRGSIFDRARDFPVRSFGSNMFRQPSPQREPSPGRQIPVFNMGPGNQQQQQYTQKQPTPPPQSNVQYDNSFQRQTPPPTQQQQQAQQSQSNQQQKGQDVTDTPVQQPIRQQPPVKEDSITKIQKIQQDVLSLMDQVDNFQGSGPKDKNYLYLEEMLTRNLLKLDDIDAEGQEHIRQARKEAIKCINHCISVLEAKAEAGGSSGSSSANNSANNLTGSNSQVGRKVSESGSYIAGSNSNTNMQNNVSHSSSTSSQK